MTSLREFRDCSPQPPRRKKNSLTGIVVAKLSTSQQSHNVFLSSLFSSVTFNLVTNSPQCWTKRYQKNRTISKVSFFKKSVPKIYIPKSELIGYIFQHNCSTMWLFCCYIKLYIIWYFSDADYLQIGAHIEKSSQSKACHDASVCSEVD